MAIGDYTNVLQQFYISYFGRPADPIGLQTAAQALSNAGAPTTTQGLVNAYTTNATVRTLVDNFGNSAESQALYGSITASSANVSAFVTSIYVNVLNRQPDVAGLSYWSGEIASGRLIPSRVALTILDAATRTPDAATVAAKLAVANNFTTNVDTVAEINAYNGNAAAAQGRGLLSQVGATTDVAAFQPTVLQALVDIVNASPAPGGTGTLATLTAGTDVLAANVFTAGLVFNPGGSDRVNALQDEDRLTGTGTNATLNATLGNANDNGGTTIAPILNNISTINVEFTGSAGGPQQNAPVTTLDLQDATGNTTINISRINSGLGGNTITFANINTSATNSFGIAGISVPANIDYDFQEGALSQSGAASTEAATFRLNAATLRSLRVSDNLVNAAGIQEGFETVTLNSTRTNQIDFLLSAQTRTLNVTGSGDLGLSNFGLNALVAGNLAGLGQAFTVSEGEYNQYQGVAINNTGGPLAAINASTATGRLSVDISSYEAGRPDPTNSGVIVYTTVNGGSADDTIISNGNIDDTNLVINGNGGSDTLLLLNNLIDTNRTNAINPNITSVENLQVRLQTNPTVVVDVSEIGGLQNILLRNETAAPAAAVFDLRELTAAQATALSINHGTSQTTGINGAAGDSTTVRVNLDDASGANDTVAITLVTDLNNTNRFNFALDADGNALAATLANAGRAVGVARVENITINDTDNESNSIELTQVAEHTGVITLNNGQAGQFLNLDATANAYRYDESGAERDGNTVSANLAINGRATNGSRNEVGAGAAERVIAASVDATNYLGNVVVRVSDNAAANSLGGQTIRMGAGNDTVIFDQIGAAAANRSTAGLTISDTVSGGAGTDILGLDGNAVAITISASEWTNVSGFEVVRLLGNGAVANVSNGRAQSNFYNLTLTNDLLANNGTQDGGVKRILIVNDNDASNDAANATAAPSLDDNNNAGNGAGANINNPTGVERGVTIDARTLVATNGFEYRGEEGGSNTADRFILSDANINGASIIDGGAANQGTLVTLVHDVDSVRNADVIEVRNAATVSEGDLAGVSNVGTLEFTNDTAAVQNSTLILNDQIVDRMVDAYQASRVAFNIGGPGQIFQNQERLVVKALDNALVQGATTGLIIQADTLSGLSALDVFVGRGTHNIATGAGNDRVVLLGGFNAGVYGVDAITGENINAFANNGAVNNFTGSINLGGNTSFGALANTDTLVTYGNINLAGGTLTGIEAFVFNSNVTLTESQFRNVGTINFASAQNHTLTIISEGAAANTQALLDLSKITVAAGGALNIVNQSLDGTTGTVGGGGAGPVVPAPGFQTVALAGNVTGVNGVAESFVFSYQLVGGRATNVNGGGTYNITGFNAAEDRLVFDDVGSATALTEAQVKAIAGVSISENPFQTSTSLLVDPLNGVGGGVVLVGIVDAALNTVNLIGA